jgi:hypothetical protein
MLWQAAPKLTLHGGGGAIHLNISPTIELPAQSSNTRGSLEISR